LDLSYLNRVVAFIDVLGFESLVKKLDADSNLHQKLHCALKRIKSCKLYSLSNLASNGVEVSVFSDSIVISAKQDNYKMVIWTAIRLQCDLLALGILVRGGIACGKTVHEKDILYGEGMLSAYKLEKEAAIYPRIIIDPSVLEFSDESHSHLFFEKDFDGLCYLNPFSMGILPSDADELAADGYDPYHEGLMTLSKVIDLEITKLSSLGHLAKWHWLKNKLKLAIVEFKKHGKPMFWHLFEISKFNCLTDDKS
jgi:hypothetical protein